MITRFVLKDAHVPAEVVETMERRIHQRMDAYFKDEAEGDTVIGVRITEQKNTYKVEMTCPTWATRFARKTRSGRFPSLRWIKV